MSHTQATDEPVSGHPSATTVNRIRNKNQISVRKTLAPDALCEEDARAVRAWLEEVSPKSLPRIDWWIEECLDWHQAEGRSRASWSKAVINWIKRAINEERKRSGESPLRSLAETRALKQRVNEAKLQTGPGDQ